MTLAEIIAAIAAIAESVGGTEGQAIGNLIEDIEVDLWPGKDEQRQVAVNDLLAAALAGSGAAAGRLYGDTLAGNPNGEPAATVSDAKTAWADCMADGWSGSFASGVASVTSPAGVLYQVAFTPPNTPAQATPPASAAG